MIEKAEIQRKLLEVLEEQMRLLNPEDPPAKITLGTRPLVDLPNFDSLMCVAVTVGCFSVFNISDEKTQTVFVEKDEGGKNRPLSVSEISDKLYELASK